jgi:hypothetical protein
VLVAALYAKDGASLIKRTIPAGTPDCAQVTPNSKAEIRWLIMAASKGSADAEWTLAQVYSDGVDAAVDQDKFLIGLSRRRMMGMWRLNRRFSMISAPTNSISCVRRK